MTRILVIAVVAMSTLATSHAQTDKLGAQESSVLFTIYLVRHAEKQTLISDPPLTSCGEKRAVALKEFWSDIPIDAVYSTDYKRTMSTAAPVAEAKDLEIQTYAPHALDALKATLMTKQQDAIVVGHSNTTAVLAGLLIGEEMGSFEESIYNRIYQVVVSNKQQRLHVFHTAFGCNDETER